MTFDGTVSPRTMLIATASPLHGANSFRHRISPLLKHSHWWRLGTHIGGNVFVKTTVTTPELESDQLYSSEVCGGVRPTAEGGNRPLEGLLSPI
ncbi:hypothetical protein U9M48_024715 [Paspalum notatum var. saurae]|uniref:Uncharacterized protein n=1 Tax=Paspalum notatum var. saurae TaxID=547442 RepID=A0AAQ3TMV0_PASNO